MWIRSQNGQQLVNINWIEMVKVHGGWAMFGGYDRDSCIHFNLGDYETKEQATAVIGIIEMHITKCSPTVFRMPPAESLKDPIQR